MGSDCFANRILAFMCMCVFFCVLVSIPLDAIALSMVRDFEISWSYRLGLLYKNCVEDYTS